MKKKKKRVGMKMKIKPWNKKGKNDKKW